MLQLDESSQELLTVAGLPLVDGVFASLLVSGSLNGFSSMLSIALTVFAGAGSLAVLFSRSDNRVQARKMVYNIFPYLFTGALAVALLAPVFSQIFSTSMLQYVTGLVLLLVAGKISGVGLAEKINTSWILLPGMMLSVRGLGFSLSLEYVVPATGTVIAASTALLAFTFLRGLELNLDIVRNGSAFVLVIFAASMFGVTIPSNSGLTVFALSFAGSFIQPRISLSENFFAFRSLRPQALDM